jgi:hypothetical protein
MLQYNSEACEAMRKIILDSKAHGDALSQEFDGSSSKEQIGSRRIISSIALLLSKLQRTGKSCRCLSLNSVYIRTSSLASTSTSFCGPVWHFLTIFIFCRSCVSHNIHSGLQRLQLDRIALRLILQHQFRFLPDHVRRPPSSLAYEMH